MTIDKIGQGQNVSAAALSSFVFFNLHASGPIFTRANVPAIHHRRYPSLSSSYPFAATSSHLAR